MKNKQVIRILEWITKLALFASIVITLFIAVSLIFTFSGEGELISTWDIEVSERRNDFSMISENAKTDDSKIIIDKGIIQFTSTSIGYYILKTVDAFIEVFAIILIIVLLRNTVRSIQRYHPFARENVRKIKYISFILILYSPYCLIKSLVYRSYIVNNIDVSGKVFTDIFSLPFDLNENEIWLNLDLNIQALFMGIILFVIAEVFRVGVLIKEDNDSIL